MMRTDILRTTADKKEISTRDRQDGFPKNAFSNFLYPPPVASTPSINGNMRFTPHPMIIAINTIRE